MQIKTSYTSARAELLGAQLPMQTKTYKPITHKQLIDLTLNSIEGAGFILGQETYTSAKDGCSIIAAPRESFPGPLQWGWPLGNTKYPS